MQRTELFMNVRDSSGCLIFCQLRIDADSTIVGSALPCIALAKEGQQILCGLDGNDIVAGKIWMMVGKPSGDVAENRIEFVVHYDELLTMDARSDPSPVFFGNVFH